VLTGGPWLFDKSILLLKKLMKEISAEEAEFCADSLWIRVFGVPYLRFSKEVGEVIGNSIGKFEDGELIIGKGNNGSYMRLRIKIDVRNPLKRGMNLSYGTDGKAWLQFRYERLPNFCFVCDTMGHVDEECKQANHDQDM
ncbi:DUF4283 domain-containing protein/zf-CCHC_4 domain-containing protein, partial [Cephalotus follicularis]